MKSIKILGPGCNRCTMAEKNVRKAVREMNMNSEIEKVTDPEIISTYPIKSTPAVVMDGKVIWAGGVPTVVDLKKLLGA